MHLGDLPLVDSLHSAGRELSSGSVMLTEESVLHNDQGVLLRAASWRGKGKPSPGYTLKGLPLAWFFKLFSRDHQSQRVPKIAKKKKKRRKEGKKKGKEKKGNKH